MEETTTKRIVAIQEWYEEFESKTGWASYGWTRRDGTPLHPELYDMEVEEILDSDKYGNPIKAIMKITI
jgi:hypothetical protein